MSVASGSFLFTHFGVSGPAAMNISRTITDPQISHPKLLQCDFLPQLSVDELRQRIDSVRQQAGNHSLVSCVDKLLPKRLVETLCQLNGIDYRTRVVELNKHSQRFWM